MNAEVGAKKKVEWVVTEDMLAVNMKSGSVKVFATPMLIAIMECAASDCLQQFLNNEDISVGACVNVNHIAATPLGDAVYAEAEIVAAEGRRVDFKVTAYDTNGMIGEGSHSRVVVNKERFEQKAYSRA